MFPRFFCFLAYLTISSSIDALMQDFYWRDYAPGDVPCDAYEGGPGLYVGQFLVRHDDRIHIQPATVYPHTNIAVSELFGKKATKEDIKILCSPDTSKFYWDYVDFTQPQSGQLREAVKGGYEYVNTYIGKVLHEQEWKISKVIPYEGKIHRGLHLWDSEDKAVHVQQFFLLKYNMSTSCFKYCSG